MNAWQPFPAAVNRHDQRGLLHPNRTRGHHFIAQTEQRLYAFNPQVAEKNRNVYRFDKTSAARHVLPAHSVNIENNLEGIDLYLLRTADDDAQYNLEAWFNRYESAYDFALAQLLALPPGQHPRNDAYEAVWRMKWLNLLRNPYLLTLPVGQYLHRCLNHRLRATAADIDTLTQTIMRTSRVSQCRAFAVSAPQYAAWLAVLCAALSEAVAKPSVFECFAADGLNRTLRHTLFRYRADMCWFGDTALCMQTGAGVRVLGLPLAARAFVTAEVGNETLRSLPRPPAAYHAPQGGLTIIDEDHDARLFFNRRTLDQSRKAVYGQSGHVRDYGGRYP